MASWLAGWRWRAREGTGNRVPPWLHLIACPSCRRLPRYASEEEARMDAEVSHG